MILHSHSTFALETTQTENLSQTKAVLSTITIEALNDLDPVRSYIDYDEAQVTRNGLKKKEIPQTINTIDVQKYKLYGRSG